MTSRRIGQQVPGDNQRSANLVMEWKEACKMTTKGYQRDRRLVKRNSHKRPTRSKRRKFSGATVPPELYAPAIFFKFEPVELVSLYNSKGSDVAQKKQREWINHTQYLTRI